jgi:hypothetical protein
MSLIPHFQVLSVFLHNLITYKPDPSSQSLSHADAEERPSWMEDLQSLGADSSIDKQGRDPLKEARGVGPKKMRRIIKGPNMRERASEDWKGREVSLRKGKTETRWAGMGKRGRDGYYLVGEFWRGERSSWAW